MIISARLGGFPSTSFSFIAVSKLSQSSAKSSQNFLKRSSFARLALLTVRVHARRFRRISYDYLIGPLCTKLYRKTKVP